MIVTEWPELRDLAVGRGSRRDARNPLIVDGRNLLDPDAVRTLGFLYEGVGRPEPVRARAGVSDMEAIILAGGKAERLGEAAHGLPKALVALAGLPLAAYQIALLAGAGVDARDRQLRRGPGGELFERSSPASARDGAVGGARAARTRRRAAFAAQAAPGERSRLRAQRRRAPRRRPRDLLARHARARRRGDDHGRAAPQRSSASSTSTTTTSSRGSARRRSCPSGSTPASTSSMMRRSSGSLNAATTRRRPSRSSRLRVASEPGDTRGSG